MYIAILFVPLTLSHHLNVRNALFSGVFATNGITLLSFAPCRAGNIYQQIIV